MTACDGVLTVLFYRGYVWGTLGQVRTFMEDPVNIISFQMDLSLFDQIFEYSNLREFMQTTVILNPGACREAGVCGWCTILVGKFQAVVGKFQVMVGKIRGLCWP